MSADPNVQLNSAVKTVKIYADIKNCMWLDNGKKTNIKDGKINVNPFNYGTSYSARILKFNI